VSYLAEWLRAFAVTEGVEIPVVIVATRVLGLAAWRRAAIAFFASLATHPIVWFVIPELGLGETARIGLSEVWAVVAEAILYAVALDGIGWRRASLASLVANSASFGIGLLMWKLG